MARGKTAEAEKKEVPVVVFPEGRMINNSLLVKDAYKSENSDKPSVPAYRVEMAYNRDDLFVAEGVVDKVFEFAKEMYGDNIYLDIDGRPDDADADTLEIVTPFSDGNKRKQARERKGKTGDAYADKIVVRSKTFFNRDGIDAEGGADMYLQDAETQITAVNKSELYNGMHAIVGVTLKDYETNKGEPAVTFYFKALQKTRDDTPLVSKPDNSKLFTPLKKADGGGAATAGAGRGRGRAK